MSKGDAGGAFGSAQYVWKSAEQLLWEQGKRLARKALGRAKFLVKCKKGAEWLNAEHDFLLYRGDQSTGRKRRMFGREARELNRDYEDKFAKDKTKQLYRWRIDSKQGKQ